MVPLTSDTMSQVPLYINKQHMGCEAQLACKRPTHNQFYRPAIWRSKVGQGDLVSDVRLGFASGSVRTKLQVSVYITTAVTTYGHPGGPKI